MKLLLNTPTQVTKEQYNQFRVLFAGLVAHRTENNKYYIKPLLFLGHKKQMELILNQ